MFKHYKIFCVVALILYSGIQQAQCDSALNGVSWVFQGTAQQNNSALTFNLYDTLNLICKASVTGAATQVIFAVSKGSIPTTMSYSAGVLTMTNIGTLIYSDVDGLQSGYENFVIFSSSPYNSVTATTLLYDFRYVNVGTLRTSDSATYHCSGFYLYVAPGGGRKRRSAEDGFFTSGGLTITVNTKSGQAFSSRNSINSYLTYSAAIMGASKLLL